MKSRAHPNLSHREEEVINLAAQGLTDNGIANRLEISASTVNSYWVRIRSKLGSLSRTELVRDYLMAGANQMLNAAKAENQLLLSRINALEANDLSPVLEFPEFSDTVENAVDCLIVVSSEGKIEQVTATASKLFGYETSEVIGASVDILVPVDSRITHRNHRRTFLEHPEVRRMGVHSSTLALRKDGSMFPVGVVLTPLESEGRIAVCCFIRDLTEELEKTRLQVLLAGSE